MNVVLSFDDGRKDNIRMVNEVLIPLQISATINITTNYIADSTKAKRPCLNPSMPKGELIQLLQIPLIEIAGHGKEHHNEISNLLEGIMELREWCGIDKIGIASPHSQILKGELELIKTQSSTLRIGYVRTGERLSKAAFIKKWIRRLNRFIHSKRLFVWIYKDTLLNEKDNFELFSVPVLHCNTLGEIEALIQYAYKADKSLILMFHSILKKEEDFYDDLWSWDYDLFYKLCKYLKNLEAMGKIKISKTIDLL